MEATRRKFLQWLGAIVAAPAIVKAAPAEAPVELGARHVIDPRTRFIDVQARDGQSWLIAEEAAEDYRFVRRHIKEYPYGYYALRQKWDAAEQVAIERRRLRDLGQSMRLTEEAIAAKAFKR